MNPVALVIDDNPSNLDVLSVLLKKEGVNSVPLQSPREIAEALVKLGHVDVVFLDLEFPNYSGMDVVGTLKTDARLQGVPIVAYTVHTSEQNEARSAGFDSFIGKPISPKRFPEQLRRILSGEMVWEVS